jgi:hypothetical protein
MFKLINPFEKIYILELYKTLIVILTNLLSIQTFTKHIFGSDPFYCYKVVIIFRSYKIELLRCRDILSIFCLLYRTSKHTLNKSFSGRICLVTFLM